MGTGGAHNIRAPRSLARPPASHSVGQGDMAGRLDSMDAKLETIVGIMQERIRASSTSGHAAAWSRHWRVCAAVAVLGCGGCGRPPVADETETWLTEPEFRIGDALEGDALFSWIPYLRATEDGRIFVLEPYISAVSVWDRDGEPVLSIGRPGQGPGDFVLPHRMHVGPDGFFVHEDSRFTFYADDGTLLRTAPGIPTSASFQGWPMWAGAGPWTPCTSWTEGREPWGFETPAANPHTLGSSLRNSSGTATSMSSILGQVRSWLYGGTPESACWRSSRWMPQVTRSGTVDSHSLRWSWMTSGSSSPSPSWRRC